MYPSGSVFTIPLGPTNPSLITIAKEPLAFRRFRLSRKLWLLVPTFSLRDAPPGVTPPASARTRTLSYRSHSPKRMEAPDFGTTL